MAGATTLPGLLTQTTGSFQLLRLYEKRINYSGPSPKMCRLADAPVGLGAYAAVVA
jgi:hypothetical protein